MQIQSNQVEELSPFGSSPLWMEGQALDPVALGLEFREHGYPSLVST